MSKFLAKLAVATTMVALGADVIDADAVQAATVTYDFTVNVEDSNFLPVGQDFGGFFSYDDSSPVYDGTIFGDFFLLKDFEFNWVNSSLFPTTYALDDIDANPFTTDETIGVFVGEGGSISTGAFFSTFAMPAMWVGPSSIFELVFKPMVGENIVFLPDVFSEERHQVTFSRRAEAHSVPEPGTLPGLAIFGLGGFLAKKKLSRQVDRG